MIPKRTPAEWWFDEVACVCLNWARGRRVWARAFAMTFGTAWMLLALLIGFPLLLWAVAVDLNDELKKPR